MSWCADFEFRVTRSTSSRRRRRSRSGWQVALATAAGMGAHSRASRSDCVAAPSVCSNPLPVAVGTPTGPSHTGTHLLRCKRGRHFAAYSFVHTKHSQKAGPFSVARLKMGLPFHNRLAYSRVHRRSARPPPAAPFPISMKEDARPGFQINTSAWVFCMSWCANFEFRVALGRIQVQCALLDGSSHIEYVPGSHARWDSPGEVKSPSR